MPCLIQLSFLTAAALGLNVQPSSRRRGVRRASSSEEQQEYDVAVIGGGPAGSMMAWALAEREGKSVVLIDSLVDKRWRANYGVWQDEWAALAAMMPELELETLTAASWDVTDCFFGGSWGIPVEERTRLERGYHRVDREKLRTKLRGECAKKGVQCVESTVSSITHDSEGSVLTLKDKSIRVKNVVDATGAETRFSDIDRKAEPLCGYQIAYGIEAVVDSHAPYDEKAMLLFDYRTDHLTEEEQTASPTFMYAMPLGPREEDGRQKIFFEETSLVDRPAMSMKECERRCFVRLEHLGINVVEIEEVELCYIPMGGNLPAQGSRVVPFGAAACFVHPSTGYQLCRAMAATIPVSRALGSSSEPDVAASRAYDAMWNRENRLQREFAVFGGEFLMTLEAEALRGWFVGFFKLDQAKWAGFLAGWPRLPGNEYHATRLNRLLFGLDMIVKLPPAVALRLAAFMAEYTMKHGPNLMRSVTPFFGDGEPPSQTAAFTTSSAVVGDVQAKTEIGQISQTLDDFQIETKPLGESEIKQIRSAA